MSFDNKSVSLTGKIENEEEISLKGTTRDKNKRVMDLELRGLAFANN